MRVALRRFRSAIKLFGDLVRSDETARVAEQAQALGRLLGAARDFDVFENEAYGPVAAAFPDDAAAFRHLIGPIRRRRAAAYREVLAYLASPAYTAFLLDAGEWAEACRWCRDGDADQQAGLAAGARDFARATLAAGHRRLCKAGRHPDRLGPEAQHDLRKRLKRYRYAVEFLAPTLPGSVRPMIRRLARLQEALGVLNDGRTARSLLARPQRRNPDGFDWAAGAIAGWHAHAAAGHLAKTAKLWKRFRKDEAFWRD
jgi:CHAD domain-containing protein